VRYNLTGWDLAMAQGALFTLGRKLMSVERYAVVGGNIVVRRQWEAYFARAGPWGRGCGGNERKFL
jgi:hypothetical protein